VETRTLERVLKITKIGRESGAVRRVHVAPFHGEYNNAIHVYNVLVLLWAFRPQLWATLGPAALFHDAPERFTGDIPGQVIDDHPELASALRAMDEDICARFGIPDAHQLSPEHRDVLKALDRLELWLWCLEQYRMGNQQTEEIRLRIEAGWLKKPLPHDMQEFVECVRWVWARMPEDADEADKWIKDHFNPEENDDFAPEFDFDAH